MSIRYKVVDQDRKSCFANGEFRLFYAKDTTVLAVGNTYGVMTFDSLTNAQIFVSKYSPWLQIIKVKPIGRGKRRKYISGDQSNYGIDNFYKRRVKVFGMPSPKGTICYPAVKVLE